jgi:hypothetical protein
MAAPIAGVVKKLFATSGTTQTVTLASGTFRTTAGSSFNKATFDSAGEALLLTGLSTALYGVFGNVNSVAFTTA